MASNEAISTKDSQKAMIPSPQGLSKRTLRSTNYFPSPFKISSVKCCRDLGVENFSAFRPRRVSRRGPCEALITFYPPSTPHP